SDTLDKKTNKMILESSYIYHIYNQGNNRQRIFFNRENYLFFLRKIHKHILPYADILAWCLMPNHFHLMVRVKDKTEGVAPSDALGELAPSNALGELALNHSIGKMLSSYTQAINKQQNRTGSLFRKQTKAECVNKIEGITPSFITKNSITEIKINNPEKEYPQVCFNYIHQNPVKAGLCKYPHEWEYSSAIDYAGGRNGKLINKLIAEKYL
ncbi:MAG: transposase, partial [Bacteroidota bacterium]|nr:transposase [Bacteroidota bacterium]